MAKIAEKIATLSPETQYFSLEFFPAKTAEGSQNLLPRLHRLRALQPLFVCVTFSAGGTTASKSLELADLCQNQLGLTTCLHLTCTNIQKSVIDETLRECRRLGIRNILALRGDEPRPGEYAPVGDSANGAAGLNGHDGPGGAPNQQAEEETVQFSHAVDLIRYIRREYGDYFCIGAAAYPEGHPVPSASHAGGFFQSPEHDLPYLVEKVEAGADFILTQLFYDVDKYLAFEKMLREHESGVFSGVPVIPGLMPVQGMQSFSRTCKLAKVGLPARVKERLEVAKGDDEDLKDIGVEIVGEIVDRIQHESRRSTSTGLTSHQGQRRRPNGFHFYTLNLEKAVAQILERCDLLPSIDSSEPADELPSRLRDTAILTDKDGSDQSILSSPSHSPMRGKGRRRRSSAAHNRVVVSRPSTSSGNADFETLENEAARPRGNSASQSKADALAIAEGEGSLGREATWDDFPNGRWGDSRSPAYAAANNYTLHPLLSPSTALALWSRPTSINDITSIFRRHLTGDLPAIPWSEDSDETGLRPETALIKEKLLRMNERNWWTIASQPAVNAAKSGDEIVGWGPKRGGLVFQKPFVEFFISSQDWVKLKQKLDEYGDEVVYFAGNAKGDFEASDEGSVHPVTWGAFKGKEIVTPTIIEAVSFRAWQDEAFAIWQEWHSLFVPPSATARLLADLTNDVWLVNVIGHDYISGRFWELLLDD